MSNWPLITLTTDFGDQSGYVAQMKGVIARFCPSATVIDISHQRATAGHCARGLVTPRRGGGLSGPDRFTSWSLIRVSVPQRSVLAVEAAAGMFVAPDNGVLTLILQDFPPRQLVRLSVSRYWRESISSTFHGRDVMSPVAAHLALGTPLSELGEPLGSAVQLALAAGDGHGSDGGWVDRPHRPLSGIC